MTSISPLIGEISAFLVKSTHSAQDIMIRVFLAKTGEMPLGKVLLGE